jgi:hypothetical protein
MLLTNGNPRAVRVDDASDGVVPTAGTTAPGGFKELDSSNAPVACEEDLLPVSGADPQTFAPCVADDDARDLGAARDFTVQDHDAIRFARRPSM